jgi:hypothetical protein
MTDRFAIVPIADGQPVPSEAIVIGPLSEVMEYISQSIPREAAEQRQAAREQQVTEVANRVADIGAHFMDQVEALAAQKEAQARADAKRKADKARRDAYGVQTGSLFYLVASSASANGCMQPLRVAAAFVGDAGIDQGFLRRSPSLRQGLGHDDPLLLRIRRRIRGEPEPTQRRGRFHSL